MMDYDPDFHEDMHDDESTEFNHEPEPEEAFDFLDDEFNTVDLAAAAGFGYHMASDEIEERKIAEDILRRRESKEPERISLKSRKSKKFKGSAAQKWMFEVATGQKTTKDPVEYTDAEKKAILEYEGERDFEF